MTDTELDRLAEGWDEEGVIYGETVRALLTECRRARAEAAALRAGPVPPAVVGRPPRRQGPAWDRGVRPHARVGDGGDGDTAADPMPGP